LAKSYTLDVVLGVRERGKTALQRGARNGAKRMQPFVRKCTSARPALALCALLGVSLSCGSAGSKDGSSTRSLLGGDGPIFDGEEEGAVDLNADVVGYFDGQACAGQSAGAESAPSVLQLLVDTSGSMDERAPGARGSKWTVTRGAVLGAISGMPADTSVGVIFYPNVPNNDREPCIQRQTAVPIAALDANGSQQRQLISRAFQRQAPAGGTPTHDAYEYAVWDMAATAATGERFLVLITDGIPTYSLGCQGDGQADDPVDSAPLIAAARDAAASGVRTFVIGSPGSEAARASLSRMAEAGGTAPAGCSHDGPNYCHFDMTRESDLAAGLTNALGIIAGVALGCRYNVPAAPDGAMLDPGKVNVLFTPPAGVQELIGQSLDNGCSEGWRYTDNQSQIRLCSNTCERVQGSEGSLSLQFGCATELR
jgi:von Willebrand factor type A domain